MRSREASRHEPNVSMKPPEREQIQRRLESLERRRKAEKAREKAESDLDRQLREAAEALSKAQGENKEAEQKRASRYLRGAAEALSELNSQTLSESEKRALLDELRRLKSKIEQGTQSEEDAARLREFEQRARGRARSKESSGAPGDDSGVSVEGNPEEPEARPGSGVGESEAIGQIGTGQSPGSGHDPDLLAESGARPAQKAPTQNVTAHAVDQGGPSETEAVRRAARVGFTNPTYGRLYLDYKAANEEVLARDRVPDGYKARVLRYFDLIEPTSRPK
jgi:hypothetical protein